MSQPEIASIDTTILLRHLLQDHDEHSPRASALLLDVRKGTKRIFCPSTVIFEAIHALHRRANIPHPAVAMALTNLIELPNFVMTDEPVVIAALEFCTQQSPLDDADCYHLALTRELAMSRIYTFDKKMDRFPGVERIEP
ncbi:MAG TPA: PIN domain-containing protein [Thermomicrobiales bacterium]|nr:PIN domain-containing protein [Thermomicrobiales bacterium]